MPQISLNADPSADEAHPFVGAHSFKGHKGILRLSRPSWRDGIRPGLGAISEKGQSAGVGQVFAVEIKKLCWCDNS